MAQGVTIDELLAQIAVLQSQLLALQGGSATGSVPAACSGITLSRTLIQGSTGSDVKCVQALLNTNVGTQVAASGVGSAGNETMNYGPLTVAAVKKFQAMYGTGSLGTVGPNTRAKMNMMLSGGTGAPTTPTTPTTPVGLTGTASIKTITDLTQYAVEDVGEGTSDVIVLGREIEMDNTGNARLQQVRVKFTHASGTETSGSSTTFTKYANSIAIWLNGNKIGSASGADFSRDSSGVYSKTFIVDSSAILNSGAKNNLTISVTAVSNLDSGDANEQWGVNIENIRYVDGTGAVITDTGTGDLELEELAKFVTLATATDIELKLVPASDNPVAKTVKVSTTTNTMNIPLLSFTMKAQGERIWVDEIPVIISTTGGANLAAVVAKLSLMFGSTTFTETLPTSGTGTDCDGSTACTVTFDDMETWIEADQTVSVKLVMEAEDIEAGTFDEGDSVLANIGSTERGNIIAEDKNGDSIASGDKTGVITGESLTFRSTGVSLSGFSSSRVENIVGVNSDGYESTFTVSFKVNAFGDTVYIPRVVSRGSSTTAGLIYTIENSSGTSTLPPTINIINTQLSSNTGSIATLNTDGLFEVPDGSSKDFSAQVTVGSTLASHDNIYRIQMGAVQFDTTSNDTTPDSTESFTPATQWESVSGRVKDAS